MSRSDYAPKRLCPEVVMSRSGYVPKRLCPEVPDIREIWPPKLWHLFISSRHSFDMYMSKECLGDAKYAFIVLSIAGLHFLIYIVAKLKILPL